MRQPVALAHAYRLLNHGPTVIVSAARHRAGQSPSDAIAAGQVNLMAAAWAMPLDFDPPKVAVVIDKATYTRELIEASGEFALQLPCREQADLTTTVGNTSGRELAQAGGEKFTALGLSTFEAECIGAPLLEGCVAWLECRVIPWPDLLRAHDLLLGEVLAAKADDRVFAHGRWQFDQADPGLRTLHHLSGGAYLLPGDQIAGRVTWPG